MEQLTREDVQRLMREKKYDEINAARRAGQLSDLLNGRQPAHPDQLGLKDLADMTTEQVAEAGKAGQLVDLRCKAHAPSPDSGRLSIDDVERLHDAGDWRAINEARRAGLIDFTSPEGDHAA